jgi:hypothetical protein
MEFWAEGAPGTTKTDGNMVFPLTDSTIFCDALRLRVPSNEHLKVNWKLVPSNTVKPLELRLGSN